MKTRYDHNIAEIGVHKLKGQRSHPAAVALIKLSKSWAKDPIFIHGLELPLTTGLGEPAGEGMEETVDINWNVCK